MSKQGTYLDRDNSYWLEGLRSKDPLQRRLACYALGEIGPAAEHAALLQETARKDPVSFVRVWAAAALTAVQPGNTESIVVLRSALQDELSFVRSLAVWFMGRLGSTIAGIEEVVPQLQQSLNDKDRSVRIETTLALKRLQCKAGSPPELNLMKREPPKQLPNDANTSEGH